MDLISHNPIDPTINPPNTASIVPRVWEIKILIKDNRPEKAAPYFHHRFFSSKKRKPDRVKENKA